MCIYLATTAMTTYYYLGFLCGTMYVWSCSLRTYVKGKHNQCIIALLAELNADISYVSVYPVSCIVNTDTFTRRARAYMHFKWIIPERPIA